MSQFFCRLGFIAFICLSPFAYSQSDACKDYKEADGKLNEVYQAVVSKYKADAAFLKKLKTAQKAWLAYRDAQLEALYPAVNKQAEYGSVYTACSCIERTELVQERVAVLKKWLEPKAEGDVCSGSRK
ncbi:MAG: DUF1311 domain-containing protein [Proteobacteria bacterium]|nr:MAG: DUF1311 domain-containing protein [Pseudomonadota bacterium]